MMNKINIKIESKNKIFNTSRRVPTKKINALFGFNISQKTISSKALLASILKLSEIEARGLKMSGNVAEIKSLFDQIEEIGPEGNEKSITGTWRLLWTTEKETLFIIKYAKFFGTQAGEVYQVIDSAARSLQNVIEFPEEGSFVVDSDISFAGNGRSDFKFTDATLNLPGNRSIKFPPVGKGWFKSIYCDGKYRLAKDVRGDYLLVVRVGGPKTF
jgi:hypothetical protein